MSLDPFRLGPTARHPSFSPSRRLERSVRVIALALSAAGYTIFRLSVGGGLLASWWKLALVEGAVVGAVLALVVLVKFLARRSVG
jgi:hypothetical protein